MAIALTFILTISLSLAVFFYFLSKEKQLSAQFRGQLDQTQNEVNFLRLEKEKSEKKSAEKIDFLQAKNLDFEKQNELLKQGQQQLEKQRQEWNKDKETMLLQLSSDLMKKNNEQQNQMSLDQQEAVKKITENLFKNFENVTAKLTALDDEVKKSTKEIDQTKSALLSPGGAGRTSEITLENILKASNLMEKENLNAVGDYVLQSHFGSAASSEAKRPDAILFLPNEQIIVIDSKSSPHFFEFSDAQKSHDEVHQKEILTKIKESFRRHLEDLKRKDYSKFLFEELRAKNSSDYKIFLVMFLQTEQMLEVIKKADKDFEQRAFEAGIIIATPVVLIHLLSNVKFVIDRFKQEKNIEVLKVEIGKLLDGLVSIVKESSELGKSINKALIGYNKLAKNLNRATVLSKNISALGIEGKKSSEVKLLEEFETEES
jgi:DNA recombination protein RmuC